MLNEAKSYDFDCDDFESVDMTPDKIVNKRKLSYNLDNLPPIQVKEITIEHTNYLNSINSSERDLTPKSSVENSQCFLRKSSIQKKLATILEERNENTSMEIYNC